jgi:hypothetical protein
MKEKKDFVALCSVSLMMNRNILKLCLACLKGAVALASRKKKNWGGGLPINW